MTTTKTVEKQIQALNRMNLATLRKTYKTVFGKDTAARSTDALRKRLTKHLREVSKGDGAPDVDRDERLPPVGTVLEREHDGKVHRVTVLAEGFKYGGETYGSLSTVAKAITKTTWNGFVFFARALKEARA
jgi:hypothetical protein